MRVIGAGIVGAALAILGCANPPTPAAVAPCPRAVSAPPGRACTLFDKSVVGWTMKRAVFESELVGGTAGDRERYDADHSRGPNGYDAFWVCTGYARAEKGAWCECPRGPSRWFEDLQEKDMPVVWVTAPLGDAGRD